MSCQCFIYVLLNGLVRHYSDTSIFREDEKMAGSFTSSGSGGGRKARGTSSVQGPQTSASKLLNEEFFAVDEKHWHKLRSLVGLKPAPWPIPSLALQERSGEHVPLLKSSSGNQQQ